MIILRVFGLLLMMGSVQAASVTYYIDPARTLASIHVEQFGFTAQPISFSGIQGTLHFDHKNANNSSVYVEIPVKNVSTQINQLDQKILQSNWLYVSKYPYITFKSTRVVSSDNKNYKILGNLTIKGVTKAVQLDTVLFKQSVHPILGVAVVGFSGKTNIKRSDFGLHEYMANVGDQISIQIRAEAIVAH